MKNKKCSSSFILMDSKWDKGINEYQVLKETQGI